MLPARLVALLALALMLGSLSLSQLRHDAGAAIHSGTEAHELPQALAEPAAEEQGAEQQEQDAGSCFDRFPWIEPALDTFFAHAWAAANASTQTTEEALEALRLVMWGKYHPGMDEIILTPNATGGVDFETREVSKHNQPHKPRCMVGLLAEAVAAHSAEVAALLAGRPMRLVVQTEDFGVVWRGQRWKLPAFSMCTDNHHSDIPVPDFTFGCYPEARYANTSWPAIQALLQRKSDMVPWHERAPELFHRSNWGVGPRRGLMPLLQTYTNGSAGMTASEAFGAELDIGNTGFVQVVEGEARRRHGAFVWLDGQCEHKYLIHTAGFSYSGGLKYKLACGSIVFKFHSAFQEFFEPALRDDVHVVALAATDKGVDEGHFRAKTAPRIKAVVDRTIRLADQPPIARAGQAFVREQLTPEALRCYWLGALQRYAQLYFMPQTPTQAAAATGGGGKAGSQGGAEEAAEAAQEAEAEAERGAAAAAERGGGGGGGGDDRLP